MSTDSRYKELVARTRVPQPAPKSAERELDSLVAAISQRDTGAAPSAGKTAPDPLQLLRESVVRDLIPAFVELVEKYSKSGIHMQMDASNLLEGGREVNFEFSMGSFRNILQGTATSEAIAFHEVQYTPVIDGQIAAGPMLRLKQLNARSFREFICERLTQLIRAATRRK